MTRDPSVVRQGRKIATEASLIPPHHLPEVLRKRLVGTVDVTALHTSGHQHLVGVLDNPIGDAPRLVLVLVRLYPPQGTVCRSPLGCVGDYRVVLISHIVPDNHAYIVKLQPLARVDAPYLVDRLGIYRPGISAVQIPAHFETELRNLHIVDVRVFLSSCYPFPAITGNHPRPVVRPVPLLDVAPQLIRVIIDPEVIVREAIVQIQIGRLPYLQRVVQPCEVSVRTRTSELRIQLHLCYRSPQLYGK